MRKSCSLSALFPPKNVSSCKSTQTPVAWMGSTNQTESHLNAFFHNSNIKLCQLGKNWWGKSWWLPGEPLKVFQAAPQHCPMSHTHPVSPSHPVSHSCPGRAGENPWQWVSSNPIQSAGKNAAAAGGTAPRAAAGHRIAPPPRAALVTNK